MINVSNKFNTLRYAKAEGFLKTKKETLERILRNSIPKGDVIATCRAAGINAAKRTSELIIFCHPIPLDWVEVDIQITEDALHVTAQVESVWKTGVEMEAIMAVTAALLNAYDMLKPIDDKLEMAAIRVIEKRGGKSQFIESFESPLKTAVLVISDSTYRGEREDKSGIIIKELLDTQPVDIEIYEILPDDKDLIRERLLSLANNDKCDLIVTTGGTGFGPKDYTPEATSAILENNAPGIVERIRSYGSERTPYAMLSRECAGTIGQCLIINLPGSPNGVRESMNSLFPAVFHIFPMLWGRGHDESK
ncbi:MAG: bifunctional molybdenum cofactor biosynthesis protein MoaC/MoaB [candidate division Zixibacteria bacterium]|nr:bifunctional molybdenum cofactor biosynthesis protein MoaC/MoaB [candidate division Zixibacteria bacterium]